MSLLLTLAIILIMVGFNALYVAAEFATVGSRRSRVQAAAEGGNRAAAGLLDILSDPKRLDTYVAACQIGITLSSLVAGSFGQARLTPLLVPALGSLGGEVAATVVVLIFITVLQVVLGELLPKTVALRYPERLAVAVLRPLQLSLALFKPLIALFNGAAFAAMRAWGLNTDHSHAHVHSPEELEDLYRQSARGGLIDVAERDMVSGVLGVEERVAREIMTPRVRLVSVPAGLSVRDALDRLVKTPYTRFPVTDEQTGDVIGMIHLRELFLTAEQNPDTLVSEITVPPLIVAEGLSVPRLWLRLREKGRHSAVVVDEYGSVAGFVTLEDTLEEIFGEMQDEFDQEDDPVTVQGQQVSMRGDVLVDTLNDRFGLNLPTDEVDTIGGLMWQGLGGLPEMGDALTFGETTLRVEAMHRRTVQRVGFTLERAEDDSNAGDAQ
ncbi:hemolysin family protein [Deinococcus arenicola]|uniref:Hemolysin family protein n=1 Tax=Deinococcus arenicola TaxID=2994950 RepID=A0ABU4DLM7_9DEIO|nr:hemolysin family protein [Deinococcus sp. ZS9-10]MDV6373346.1 hemolysin family protein [Deinococcus sp. ZS9-10]